MASTKRFTTGGGFPYEGSPGRPIEFTLSYGRSGLLPNPDEYTHRLEFSDPEDSAYVCGMYGPPRDKVGLQAFADQLAEAYREVADDPEYRKLPMPPLKFFRRDVDAQAQAEGDIASERVARTCLWARQFGPGTKLSIDLADGAGSASASTPLDRQNLGSSAEALPVRYLSSRIAGRSAASSSDASAAAARVPSRAIFPPDRLASDDRFGSWIASPPATAPRDRFSQSNRSKRRGCRDSSVASRWTICFHHRSLVYQRRLRPAMRIGFCSCLRPGVGGNNVAGTHGCLVRSRIIS